MCTVYFIKTLTSLHYLQVDWEIYFPVAFFFIIFVKRGGFTNLLMCDVYKSLKICIILPPKIRNKTQIKAKVFFSKYKFV